MDTIKAAITCVNCKHVLSDPIVLPCGHSICRSHTTDLLDEQQILCAECGVSHANNNTFPDNKSLASLIAIRIGSIDFGHEHVEAKESCGRLKDELANIELILNDISFSHSRSGRTNFVHETIGDLKNRVLLRSEELKLAIDDAAQKILDDLSDYETCCEENFDTVGFKSLFGEFVNLKESTQTQLKSWLDRLNELRIDQTEWKSIKFECDDALASIQKRFESFKDNVLLNQIVSKTNSVKCFEIISLDFLSNSSYQWDSTILQDHNLKSTFLKLLELDSNAKLQLRFRASDHGFTAKDFHAHCDNIPNTIIIIQSASDYVFGGFTSKMWNESPNEKVEICLGANNEEQNFIHEVNMTVSEPLMNSTFGNNIVALQEKIWDSPKTEEKKKKDIWIRLNTTAHEVSGVWNQTIESPPKANEKEWKESTKFVGDFKALIFSLVNKYKTSSPIMMRVNTEQNAIGRNIMNGPIFGEQYEIFICENFKQKLNFSRIGTSFDVPKNCFLKENESLAEENYFQVKELEVFELLH